MVRYETPIPSVDGVEIVHTPVFKTEDYSPEAMAKCVHAHVYYSRNALIAFVAHRRFELYASGKTEVRLC